MGKIQMYRAANLWTKIQVPLCTISAIISLLIDMLSGWHNGNRVKLVNKCS